MTGRVGSIGPLLFNIFFGMLFILDGATGRFGLREEKSPTLIGIGAIIICWGIVRLLAKPNADE